VHDIWVPYPGYSPRCWGLHDAAGRDFASRRLRGDEARPDRAGCGAGGRLPPTLSVTPREAVRAGAASRALGAVGRSGVAGRHAATIRGGRITGGVFTALGGATVVCACAEASPPLAQPALAHRVLRAEAHRCGAAVDDTQTQPPPILAAPATVPALFIAVAEAMARAGATDGIRDRTRRVALTGRPLSGAARPHAAADQDAIGFGGARQAGITVEVPLLAQPETHARGVDEKTGPPGAAADVGTRVRADSGDAEAARARGVTRARGAGREATAGRAPVAIRAAAPAVAEPRPTLEPTRTRCAVGRRPPRRAERLRTGMALADETRAAVDVARAGRHAGRPARGTEGVRRTPFDTGRETATGLASEPGRALGGGAALGPERSREARAERPPPEVPTLEPARTRSVRARGQAEFAPAEARTALEVLPTGGAIGHGTAPETDGLRSEGVGAVGRRLTVRIHLTPGKTEPPRGESDAGHARRTARPVRTVPTTAARRTEPAATFRAGAARGVLRLRTRRTTGGAGDVPNAGRRGGTPGPALGIAEPARTVSAAAVRRAFTGLARCRPPAALAKDRVALGEAEAVGSTVARARARPLAEREGLVGHAAAVTRAGIGCDRRIAGLRTPPAPTYARTALRAGTTWGLGGPDAGLDANAADVQRKAGLPGRARGRRPARCETATVDAGARGAVVRAPAGRPGRQWPGGDAGPPPRRIGDADEPRRAVPRRTARADAGPWPPRVGGTVKAGRARVVVGAERPADPSSADPRRALERRRARGPDPAPRLHRFTARPRMGVRPRRGVDGPGVARGRNGDPHRRVTGRNQTGHDATGREPPPRTEPADGPHGVGTATSACDGTGARTPRRDARPHASLWHAARSPGKPDAGSAGRGIGVG
jgi:hypothetical protein